MGVECGALRVRTRGHINTISFTADGHAGPRFNGYLCVRLQSYREKADPVHIDFSHVPALDGGG